MFELRGFTALCQKRSYRWLDQTAFERQDCIPLPTLDMEYFGLKIRIIIKLKQHPDKTDIGRISNGFDFLDYQFGQEKNNRFKTNFAKSHSSNNAALWSKKHLPNWQMLLDDYRQHWAKWVYSAIPSSIINFDSQSVDLRLLLKTT
ncbi:hypothetical protein EOE67_14395 [Rheinheimera riviphila]|uniref:Uncharacterized protein n=1 Tax=Rheinheimera riviphila TaxID=1834037 RepID=A0A437QLK5_9GAMM|nr:hypothetical protein [Rheinheimera riviphila]RVU35362.1 hypothetical protein EOE67_14395 [Rheinheimera riviphila]